MPSHSLLWKKEWKEGMSLSVPYGILSMVCPCSLVKGSE